MHVSLAELSGIALVGGISGTLGAITGIGGGVIIVPALILVFGFDFPSAVAASLAAVIATSTTAGGAYVGEGLTNMRLAMTLEVATTVGGISGGLLGVVLSERVLAALFAVAMAATAYLMARGRSEHEVRAGHDDSNASTPPSLGPLDTRYLDPELGRKVVYPSSRQKQRDSCGVRSCRSTDPHEGFVDKRRISRAVAKYVVNPVVKVVAGYVPWWSLLETTGRKTGRPWRDPVGNGLDGDTFWIVAEHGHQAGYVKNLKASPRVRLRVGGRWRSGFAHVLEDDDARARQRRLGNVNAAFVRLMGTDLLTVRVDLNP